MINVCLFICNLGKHLWQFDLNKSFFLNEAAIELEYSPRISDANSDSDSRDTQMPDLIHFIVKKWNNSKLDSDFDFKYVNSQGESRIAITIEFSYKDR